MEVPLLVLADYANVSIEGKLNILGIFSNVNASALPFTLAQMQIVFMLRYAPIERGQTKEVDVRLEGPDGELLIGFKTTLPLPADAPLSGDVPQVISLNGLTFTRYGDHALHVLVNGEPKARVGFTVKPLEG